MKTLTGPRSVTRNIVGRMKFNVYFKTKGVNVEQKVECDASSCSCNWNNQKGKCDKEKVTIKDTSYDSVDDDGRIIICNDYVNTD